MISLLSLQNCLEVDLYELKKRILLCIEKVQEDKFMRPTRIVSPSTGCGFVLIPVQSAILSGANLSGANLRFATNLSVEEIQSAVFDRKTQFPSYIRIRWTSESSCEFTGGAHRMVK